SRSAPDYRQMLLENLYHPPSIALAADTGERPDPLHLIHRFEEKPLHKEFIANTLMGIEFLWGGPVSLETHEALPRPARSDRPPRTGTAAGSEPEPIQWQTVMYEMKGRELKRRVVNA
ncbi:MAG: SpoVR family protein, partial [Desulfatitalea sp.]|nr:SpoVR family protein [Desulfatitalea sp.]